jgi:crotonobetainyl-CoA:carnitine CoA-transferase CaiB-like acyl-CoA transferase
MADDDTGRAWARDPDPALPLSDVRVIDAGMLLAGPQAATYLADLGADVIKVEHPTGDPIRHFGWQKDGVGIWWKSAGRNKRSVTLNLGSPEGQELLLELARDADILIESFRPGTMERWNLGYERLAEANPGLIMVRTSGFGQTGPYSHRPGFGTLAEAMSGLAQVLGEADRPPIVPPIPFADGVAALFGTFAALAALHERNRNPERRGQTIDVSLLEPAMAFVGPQVTVLDLLGTTEQRDGSRAYFSAPRNVYGTRDERFVAVSTSAQSAANRLFEAIGRPELIEDERFSSGQARRANADEIDKVVADWVAERELDEVLRIWEEHGVTGGPIYTVQDLAADEHLHAREAFVEVEDEELGPIRLNNVFPRLERTPGAVRHAGRPLGADTDAVLGQLGRTAQEIAQLRETGVIR